MDGLCSKTKLINHISRAAVTALLYEVSTSPKPGLVDRYNSGAHRDMDFFSFMRSSTALYPYFAACACEGMQFEDSDSGGLFRRLRPLGMDAEKEMLSATGGANTHKGLIFSIGIICAAAGLNCASAGMNCASTEMNCAVGGINRAGTCRYPLEVDEICKTVSEMTQGICKAELENIGAENEKSFSNGERVFKRYGVKGIRQEVEEGFPTVRKHSLPILSQLNKENKPLNDALVQTLLHLMAVNVDTNILARKDMKTLKLVQTQAAEAIAAGGMFTPKGIEMIYQMDKDFIIENISPGGSADLLAVTAMLHFLQYNKC